MNTLKHNLKMVGLALLLGACSLNHAPQPHSQNHQQNQSQNTVSGSLNSYTASVSKVADGDTITVLDGHGNSHKIRLAYIDAPELAQDFGTASRDALIKLVRGETVQIVVTDIDRYKREVAQVFIGNKDVNLQQIQQGNAWHYLEYAKKQTANDYQNYQSAEQAAKQKRAGLWQNPNAQAPWLYRKAKRTQ